MNLQILTGTETGMTERIAIEDLLGTLELATPEEKKKLMQANVAEVQIPQQEEPLLVSNPEGLLTSLGCFFRLVTPRGVEPPFPG